MNNLIKIAFILDHDLKEYRFPFFLELASRGYDIHIYHGGPDGQIGSFIKVFSIDIYKFGGLQFRRLPVLNDFSIVIFMQNIRILNVWFATLNPLLNYKIVHWGIGTSSSNGLSLRKTFISQFRNILARFASAQILYSDFPLPLFDDEVKSKTFIANNTIHNPLRCDLSPNFKDSFLFIGSLNKRKGLEVLISSFGDYLKSADIRRINTLIIIGSGPIEAELRDLVDQRELNSNIIFTGNISEEDEKKKYFSRAVASVSPLQAGLSVLESFSYGVPFISFVNAISGGEHLNIQDYENGFLVKSQEELVERLLLLNNNPSLAEACGRNAFQYYIERRQMKHMVDAFDECFKFVLNRH